MGNPREASPNSELRQSAARLSELLSSITRTGEIELTPGAELTGTLRTAFAEAGEGCQFRFLPSYENGVFADPDTVLTWLYCSGHSKGAAFSTLQVDAWLYDWFGPDVRWTHESTEDYNLTELGVYMPGSVAWSGKRTYWLEYLEHREDGSFLAKLRISQTDETLTVVLTADDGGLRFSYIGSHTAE